ncbi:MAG: uracil-DNA glycosylase [Bdellovibrionales bacterium RIFOXYD12_FULL_39_22]|nr:MAG: uracil-DNA glycosylase [Bdellovibrionales bacterium RIFOXYB1_FULL_39_21]OFZ42720.1 MAG: uracil-DNA glycosylase [Bdellovibrionales bacterium RIFOXYC12_FULL_39_17]OFZ47279.1 MAG: uracil-DNA glycosylase [Bdellovibrionales bacterium RIFOXYC1_FULL_39_130]OFZ75445.1 MAG: uracil-DNA glycosylase [Bdellovibrionales bacterium RIFOXYD1_FULL_39_84]OFZ93399.1 MAG: uracil-DNA glycosylase [Bdellovibrionales bacterium RIFOXYD12_FULL_39_22]
MQHLGEEFSKPYMASLRQFLAHEFALKKIIYPPSFEIFSAFLATPFDAVKVAIIGQDPYHGPGQAHGLSFSVKPNIPPPPSLLNIYKELSSDLGIAPPNHGFLESWSKQGVLLLNSILTVEQNRPASHHQRGWEQFTDKVLEALNLQKKAMVFILWGSYAQSKGANLNDKKHLIIRSPHPSPLSAYRGFFGSRPFSQANKFLESNDIAGIDWEIPSLFNTNS